MIADHFGIGVAVLYCVLYCRPLLNARFLQRSHGSYKLRIQSLFAKVSYYDAERSVGRFERAVGDDGWVCDAGGAFVGSGN